MALALGLVGDGRSTRGSQIDALADEFTMSHGTPDTETHFAMSGRWR